jgi:hypothetical protein
MVQIMVDREWESAVWELAEFATVREARDWGRLARVVYPLDEGFRVVLSGEGLAGPIPLD